MVNKEERILYKYNTDEPIKYFNTEMIVNIPTQHKYLKQEFRGVWVCTIWNLDFPKQTSIEQFKQEFYNILGLLEAYNMNVLLFQVRPKNDAFYQSNLNPWSRFLTGQEGVSPGWDPLSWMIEVTHQHGIEFHAWFNPYRVFTTDLSPNNFASIHPEYVLKLTLGEEIFNPGIPDVQQFIIDTVVEVAENYKIDGVHFDDYFYPYGGLNPSLDFNEYSQYNKNQFSLDDWRRENVNHVIKSIKEKLTKLNRSQNKAIVLGMSPFGIWENNSKNSLGSSTKSGVSSFSELYADSYRWVKGEWIDYIVPQTYFEFTETNAPYADLVKWWADLVKDTKVCLFTGQSIYRYKEKGWRSEPWVNPNELPNQLLYNSKYEEVTGSVYFRSHYLKPIGPENLTIGQNALKNTFFKYKVLPPFYKNIESTLPNAPVNLIVKKINNHFELSWEKDINAKAYYIYRFTEGEIIDLSDIKKVISIVRPEHTETLTFIDESIPSDTKYTYYVTGFNSANHEGPASFITT